ncbi:MAG: hypothetical protein ACXWV0_04805 [Flavisolibacter sp.]
MTLSSYHTQTCLDAWFNCENVLVNTARLNHQLSRKVIKVIDECALICMGTFHAITVSSANMSRMAILCMGICEECAELCESLEHEIFKECARICRTCSDSMSRLAFTDLQ